ncbi:DUF1963 domain-containing protein [Phormidesmis sp. 146-35]
MPEFDGPLSGSAALKFEKKFAPISACDYRFNESLGDLLSQVFSELVDEYAEKVYEGTGHRIGGYPGFTQTDLRDWNESYRNYDCLLFQLDSDRVTKDSNCSIDLMWGDNGIANFFITSEALKRLDFSDVLYNWDCC